VVLARKEVVLMSECDYYWSEEEHALQASRLYLPTGYTFGIAKERQM
jgi:hypothetical protein